MDRFLINGRPQPFDVQPYSFTLSNFVSTVPTIVITGRFFPNITNVYVTSDDLSIFSLSASYINPFYNVQKLSSNNLGFSGIDISNYATLNSQNYITIQLPEIFQASGYFDIIIQNEVGFGRLSQDSIVPFISSYSGAINIQRPCVSGIYVNNLNSTYIPIYEFLTEQGIPFITENNIFLIAEKYIPYVPINNLLTEQGIPIITENNIFVIAER